MEHLIQEATQDQIKKDVVPFRVGDGVKVHVLIKVGDKERTQIFAGIVIARRGSGRCMTDTFTVRRVNFGEGVERIFPVHSPLVSKIEVDRPSKFKRSKLYYMRKLKGKSANKVNEIKKTNLSAK